MRAGVRERSVGILPHHTPSSITSGAFAVVVFGCAEGEEVGYHFKTALSHSAASRICITHTSSSVVHSWSHCSHHISCPLNWSEMVETSIVGPPLHLGHLIQSSPLGNNLFHKGATVWVHLPQDSEDVCCKASPSHHCESIAHHQSCNQYRYWNP
mgnify:CR=1 FL=1